MATRKGAAAHTAANAVQIAEQRIQAYNLRLDGNSLDVIAKIMGVSVGTVCNRINAEIKDRVEPLAAEARQIQLDRLDRWLVQLNEQIMDGRAVARNVEVAIRVEERRAKLLGIDEALKIDATVVTETEQDRELAELLREAKAKAAVVDQSLHVGQSRE